MAHKNDYTCIVFYKDDKPKKWGFVHGLSQFIEFINEKHSGWIYINVYDRRTGKFLKRFYQGNVIPYFLTFIPFAIILYFFLTFNSSPSITFAYYDIYNRCTIPTLILKIGGAPWL
jgi:hypothetical protein